MRVFNVDGLIILRGTKAVEPKFRVALSNLVLEKFGSGPFNQNLVTEIIYFCRDYYISEFEKICNQETSYSFYKEIVWLHEQATTLRFKPAFNNLPEGLDQAYIGSYRRVLKLIIEQGCLVDMVSGEKRDEAFRDRIHSLLNELLFLGEMIYRCSESIAEQSMIEDAHDVVFDKDGLYVFERKHHYEMIFQYISNEMEKHKPEYIMDSNGSEDFEKALKECFGINYNGVKGTLGLVMEKKGLKPGDVISADCESIIKDVANFTETDEAIIDKFFSGFSLHKGNKHVVSELMKKPHSLDRYLYRPLLKWQINRKSFYVLGNYSWFEAENSLFLNAIPWGKYPSEWEGNACFNQYVNKKKDEHDKWLDDKVEQIILSTGLSYQRSVKKLATKKKSYSLLIKDLGEIDFLIICPKIKKVLVAECKHLMGRYDMVNWKNDFDHFTGGGSKSYNVRLKSKVQWLTENKNVLQEHFQKQFNNVDLSIQDYEIAGVFFINTPTFYMYNSDFRIYTFDQIEKVLTGQHQDPAFTLYVDQGDSAITYSAKYPYFQKPKMLYYNNEDDDLEIDKYGFPIKNEQ
jgi:hypothetical protein